MKRIKNRWRELGGALSIFYRLDRSGKIELQGRLQSPDQINTMCQELAGQLQREWQLRQEQAHSYKNTSLAHQNPLFDRPQPQASGPQQQQAMGLSRIPELKPDPVQSRTKKRRAG